jgi:hypothetical protein
LSGFGGLLRLVCARDLHIIVEHIPPKGESQAAYTRRLREEIECEERKARRIRSRLAKHRLIKVDEKRCVHMGEAKRVQPKSKLPNKIWERVYVDGELTYRFRDKPDPL